MASQQNRPHPSSPPASTSSSGRRGSLRPWTKEEKALLGSATDAEIARRIGRDRQAVRLKRVLLHLPATRPLRAWTDKEERILGTMPDEKAANLLGRSRQSVATHRRRLRGPCNKPW